MDSINKQQTENNHADLNGSKAVEKIRELVKSAQTCFFCTMDHSTEGIRSRPMNVREVDDEGNLWFLSANDSHKNFEIAQDAAVTLFFQGSPHSDFMQLTGRADVSTDQQKIEELWTPVIKTWFTEGKDDPRITAIKVSPQDGYYWDTKHGDMVAGIKIMIGAALGKTMDDSIEGELKV